MLDDILNRQRRAVARLRRGCSLEKIKAAAAAAPPPQNFAAALVTAAARGRLPIIAEAKKASPSRGLLCENFNAARLARQYKKAGASCLSVLTHEDFLGKNEDLIAAKKTARLPALRKDFMVSAWQIYESRALGADAVLLIVAGLTEKELHQFAALAGELKMTALVEIHNKSEAKKAAALIGGHLLFGVNNRNLRTFKTSLKTGEAVIPYLRRLRPDVPVAAESGMHSAACITRMRKAGADAFLIGERLVTAPDPGAALRELFS